MPVNPLSNIFNDENNLNQEEKGIAFLAGEITTLSTFKQDVANLCSVLKNESAHSIAICCEDSYYFSVAFFATFYANKKVVLPGNHQPAMLASLSGHFDLIIDDGLLGSLSFCQQLRLPIQITHPVNVDVFPSLVLTECILTIFTSGSSGDPKAIVKTLAMLDKEIVILEQCWGTQIAGSQIVSTVSHQHIYGLLFRVLWPLCAGRMFDRHDLIYPEQITKNPLQKKLL